MKRKRLTRLPTAHEIQAIGVVPIVEFELSKKETTQLRKELYRINKDGIRRYRTLKEGSVVLVWRIK